MRLPKFILRLSVFIYFLIPFESYSQKIEEVEEIDTVFIEKDTFEGKIFTVEWESKYLNELRKITIYEPPNYDKRTEYGVLFVTDGITQYIADDIESLILNKTIEPIIVVGVNLRKPQDIDSVFKDVKVDFRNLEFLKVQWERPSYKEFNEDSVIAKILSDRYNRFSQYTEYEIIPYVKKHYSVTGNKKKWALGGFSGGGAFVYAFSCDYPAAFGNTIAMSPGGANDYDVLKSDCKYFICAGKDEPYGFIDNSEEYLSIMDKNDIPYLHKTYNCGHDWRMWQTFYLESITEIYKY